MKSKWSSAVNSDSVLSEYPRPQMVRDNFTILNGLWDYAITDSPELPAQWDGKILVPFSPESELSGVCRTLMPGQWLWYRRGISPVPAGGRIILHFGAVDQYAEVYINGRLACSHSGGYTSFSCDITDLLESKNILTLRVRDDTDASYHSRGKQKLEHGGIWYTPQSGIWQTVWMERVPEKYISGLRITPLFDESRAEITVSSEAEHSCTIIIDGREFFGQTNCPVSIDMTGFIPWTPEQPKLYSFTVLMGNDKVDSYFGMRKFSVAVDDNGVKRLFLNNRPYFHTGLLDQGYFSDGLYTAPCDEAIIYDIQLAKDMGFNMLRKHIKVEPLRWYYHCDRLGMLVWQDMVNGGDKYHFMTISAPVFLGSHSRDNRYRKFARTNASGRDEYYRELDEMTDQLYNCTSIAMWVPFNEGWGQFDAAAAVERISKKDTTRTIDHASGWYDQHIGEIRSMHVYFRRYHFRRDRNRRAVVLSEFGGYNFCVTGHSWSEKIDSLYSKFKSPESLFSAFRSLYEKQIIPAKQKGLCAAVYTQLTDVEDELNGMITYDREVVKLPVDGVKRLNEQLKETI